MNRTQKKILGWALVAIGLIMVAGAAVDSQPKTNLRGNVIDSGGVLQKPVFFLGLVLAAAGVGVLGGYKKRRLNTVQLRVTGWALVLIGVWVLSSVIIQNLAESTFFATSPFFYVGCILIVSGVVVLAADSAKQVKMDFPQETSQGNQQQGASKEIQQKHPHMVSPAELEVTRLCTEYQEAKREREEKSERRRT